MCEEKFILVEFQTKENFNRHKNQSFIDIINKMWFDPQIPCIPHSDRCFSNEKPPDNCQEIIAPMIEEPSHVIICQFLDKNWNEVELNFIIVTYIYSTRN